MAHRKAPRPPVLSTPGPGMRRDAFSPRPAPLAGPRLWVVLARLAGFTAAALALCSCTALPPLTCPLGTYPGGLDERATASGTASAAASVITQSGKGDGSGKATRSITGACRPMCQYGQLLEATRGPNGVESVRCTAIPPVPPAPLPPGHGTSSLPPQGDQHP